MQSDTVSALRDLYRASEARAARLRLLMEAGRDLALADNATLEGVLAQSARRAALFAGCREGEVILGADAEGLPLIAPGPERRSVGALRLLREGALEAGADPEDQGALMLLAQLMGAAIDRAARERERDQLLTLLRERERRLEHVVDRLFSAQEEERRRVSRDLHDGVAQTATALFRRLDAAGAGGDEPNARDLADIAKSLVQELRRVIGGLRPTALDDLGLVAAIAAMADDLRRDGYAVDLRTEGPDRWPAILETAFFRVAQEALTNVRKHAGGPCKVDVRVSGDPVQRRWDLVIADDGVGFAHDGSEPGSPDGGHIGLEVMRERMVAIGGGLQIRGLRPQGVEIRAAHAEVSL
jgi:two-component system, NarL family, sensor kinase